MNEERDLRAHLNDLWKTTVEQFDEIKDVIIRNSHVARKKIDTAGLKQQRNRLLQELGSSVYQQVREHGLALAPEGQRYVERLDEVMAQIATEQEAMAAAARAAPAVSAADDEPTQENEAVVKLPVAAASQRPSKDEPAKARQVDTKKSAATPDQAVDVVESSSDKEASEEPKRRRRPRRRRKKPEDETSSNDE